MTTSWRRRVLPVAAIVVAVDQATKRYAVRAFRPPVRLGPVTLTVTVTHNPGFSLGIGGTRPVLVTVAAVAVSLLITGLAARASRRSAVPLGLLLGGAVGNLVDRLVTGGHAVTDWLQVWGYPPTFNLADVAVRVGAMWWILASMRSHSASRVAMHQTVDTPR